MSGTKTPDRYLELVRRFPLRPIRTEAENDEAVRIAEQLDFSGGELSAEEEDYLEVLISLIEKFEDEHYPVGAVSAEDMLRHLIEARSLTQAQVAAGTGIAESALSEMLAGKRNMGRKMIEKLAKFFRVDPGLFLTGGSAT